MSSSRPVVMWFREDLRLGDNPALNTAFESGAPVICLYILETVKDGSRPLGGASKWWLHQSLSALAEAIEALGGQFVLRKGAAQDCLLNLVEELNATAVFWNRRYDAGGISVDSAIKTALKTAGVEGISANGRLLTEPWQVRTGAGAYYKVFTPYWKSVRANYRAPPPLPKPDYIGDFGLPSDTLDTWNLLPQKPDWAVLFPQHWEPGETGAHARLERWLDGAIDSYSDQRNRPDVEGSTSGLSPHLRWGEISPVQVWRAVHSRIGSVAGSSAEDSAWTFLSEIVWREFSYVLLYHNPRLADVNYNIDFQHMPWRDNSADYERWCEGQTGYPIVDAGMRELWHTGWMHNRVRMIVGSFLTKHLLLPWQMGEDWFWDTLVDADPASNAASWQWVAGSGADAAPYFRVFNPITQGSKFDETGAYVRRWCPELEALPDKYLHSPWDAPGPVLRNAGIALGETYPHPMVDHKTGRQRALDAYDTLKERRAAI
ncbi:MAG: deoxyribodipyrimidine photo-lyase [Pseudomonadota bacterium]